MTLILGEELLKGALKMSEAIDLIEEVYQHEAAGKTISAPRQTTVTEQGWMRLMYAADFASGYAATKAFHLTRNVGVRYVVSLYRLEDGELLAILDARELTALRTGAVSGVAARYMAPQGANTAGILGSGNQSITQLEAIAAELPLVSACVFSPTPENRRIFAERMSERLNLEIIAVDSAQEALQGQPVALVSTNTVGPDPVMDADWLSDPTLVCGVGSTRMESVEIDLETFSKSQLTVIDTDHAAEEAGDLRRALDGEVVNLERFWNLAKLVEMKPKRPSAGVTVFKSVGSGLQDLAVAVGYYERLKLRDDLIDMPGLASLKTPRPWRQD
jgi:ornithine cyclodeaminase/alanine dehydrogenase-like protein (mu-crystallin family)